VATASAQTPPARLLMRVQLAVTDCATPER
jgi:hypothetical protein